MQAKTDDVAPSQSLLNQVHVQAGAHCLACFHLIFSIVEVHLLRLPDQLESSLVA